MKITAEAIKAAAELRDHKASALIRATAARKQAEADELAMKRSYEAACVDYGRAVGPEGFTPGEAVKRDTVRRGSYDYGMRGGRSPDRTVTERGIVTLCDGPMNYRNHYPKPGEWFVLSKSGQTAYSLFDKDGNALWIADA